MNKPRVSICIPVYNAEDFIGAAISSVLGQTYHDYELIVLNNCSTDRTMAVVDGFNDPRIRVIQQQTNIGALGNFNRALAEARGDYVKVLCADDLIYNRCLELQVAVFDRAENSNIAIVTGSSTVIDIRGRRKINRSFPGHSGVWQGSKAVTRTIRSGRNIIGEPSVTLIRASVSKEVGEFDGSLPYVLDLDYWCRMLEHGDLYVLRDVVSAFRISDTSWSSQLIGKQAAMYSEFIERVRKRGKHGLTAQDCYMGKMLSSLNSILRKIVYRFMA